MKSPRMEVMGDRGQTNRATRVRLHHECAGWVTYFDVRMAPAAEFVGSVALPRRSKRRRWSL